MPSSHRSRSKSKTGLHDETNKVSQLQNKIYKLIDSSINWLTDDISFLILISAIIHALLIVFAEWQDRNCK